MAPQAKARPNIILILVDDLGFADLGCYGSEIRTPNLDRLAEHGLRFTQMYNWARCCPSRAALLTGLSPHQAGVGHMTIDYGVPGYRGYLNDHCATVAEVLSAHGYRTLMSGKWHVGGDFHPPEPPGGWPIGATGYPTPRQRGFDRVFAILGGYGSYFKPFSLVRDDTPINVESADFYLTDAISDAAVEMIRESVELRIPFFLYLSYTAPHWPLHALEEDIARYEGRYRGGWDRLRTSRHEQMKGMGLVNAKWEITPRDEDAPPWEEVRHKDWEDLRMAVYAAQIDRMDRGVGRVMATLRERAIEDNTLIMFLSDNGGCAELFLEDTEMPEPSVFATPTVGGRLTRVGNIPGLRPGPADTFMSYDLPWANASNSPFRLFKRWVHEGGISTPFIVYWPAQIKRNGIIHEPALITDITATCIDVAGAAYPAEFRGKPIPPLEGESLMPVIEGGAWERERPMVWEHEGNRAIRMGQWKLVSEFGGPWELYDMNEDRTELHDLSQRNRPKVEELSKQYEEWAERSGVIPWPPWPVSPNQRPFRMRGRHTHIAGLKRPRPPSPTR